jgi:predicted P-loop ATPase
MFDAVIKLAHAHARNPIVEYLAKVQAQWDGKPRLDAWLTAYAQAEDTELHRAFGRLTLMAAVRRARRPGCKFDQILVLESPEGYSKSTALEVLAGGPEYFCDVPIFGLDVRQTRELLAGVWVYEAGDLGGLRKADVDKLKTFISRTEDKCRLAYDRTASTYSRACIIIGTTNNAEYLMSQTGNRRFWPVKVGRINVDALRRNRDQLWGEAATREAAGESIFLPEHLWASAGEAQEERRVRDDWEDELAGLRGEKVSVGAGKWEERIHTSYINNRLGLRPAAMAGGIGKRLRTVMEKLGWKWQRNVWWFGARSRGYVRPCDPIEPDEVQVQPPFRVLD